MARSTSLLDLSTQVDIDRAEAQRIVARQDDEQERYYDEEKARLGRRAARIKSLLGRLNKALEGVEEEIGILDELWLEKEYELRRKSSRKPR